MNPLTRLARPNLLAHARRALAPAKEAHPLDRPAAKCAGVGAILLFAVAGLGASLHDSAPLNTSSAQQAALLALPDARIDVNSATAAQFRALPGIGPALAERIIDDRDLNGPFDTIADLDRVRGIGPRTVLRLADHAVALPPPPAP